MRTNSNEFTTRDISRSERSKTKMEVIVWPWPRDAPWISSAWLMAIICSSTVFVSRNRTARCDQMLQIDTLAFKLTRRSFNGSIICAPRNHYVIQRFPRQKANRKFCECLICHRTGGVQSWECMHSNNYTYTPIHRHSLSEGTEFTYWIQSARRSAKPQGLTMNARTRDRHKKRRPVRDEEANICWLLLTGAELFRLWWIGAQGRRGRSLTRTTDSVWRGRTTRSNWNWNNSVVDNDERNNDILSNRYFQVTFSYRIVLPTWWLCWQILWRPNWNF